MLFKDLDYKEKVTHQNWKESTVGIRGYYSITDFEVTTASREGDTRAPGVHINMPPVPTGSQQVKSDTRGDADTQTHTLPPTSTPIPSHFLAINKSRAPLAGGPCSRPSEQSTST